MSTENILNAEAFNLDSLLEGTLDDLANVPDFVQYPAGTHRVNISWEMPTKERPTTIGLKFVLIATEELNDANDVAPPVGSLSNISFKMDNEYGQSNYRKVIASLSSNFGPGTNREIMEKSEGAECMIVTTLKAGKKTEQNQNPSPYLRLVEIHAV